MLKSSLHALVISLLALACGKHGPLNEGHKPEFRQFTETLQGKSREQVFALKYDAMILSCAIHVQSAVDFDPLLPPDHSFQWDLKKNLYEVKTFDVSNGLRKGQLTLHLSAVEISPSLHLSVSSGEFQLAFTPVVSLYQEGEYQHMLGEGVVTERKAGIALTLHENIGPLSRTDSRSLNEDPVKMIENLTCELKTEIRPEYQEQFVKLK